MPVDDKAIVFDNVVLSAVVFGVGWRNTLRFDGEDLIMVEIGGELFVDIAPVVCVAVVVAF